MEDEPDDAERTRPPLMTDLVYRIIVPFASPTLLWKIKQTYREKGEIDRSFLRKLLQDRGEWPVV